MRQSSPSLSAVTTYVEATQLASRLHVKSYWKCRRKQPFRDDWPGANSSQKKKLQPHREFSRLKGNSIVVLRHLDFKKLDHRIFARLCLSAGWNLRQIIKQSRTVGEKSASNWNKHCKDFQRKTTSSSGEWNHHGSWRRLFADTDASSFRLSHLSALESHSWFLGKKQRVCTCVLLPHRSVGDW